MDLPTTVAGEFFAIIRLMLAAVNVRFVFGLTSYRYIGLDPIGAIVGMVTVIQDKILRG